MRSCSFGLTDAIQGSSKPAPSSEIFVTRSLLWDKDLLRVALLM